MRCVVFTGAGGAEVMELQERPDPVPGPDEVLVDARFAGINPADLAQRAGRYPAPAGSPQDVPGLEVAGMVRACGERVTAWREGDRVFGIVGGGGLASTVVVHERHVARIPDALADREAAAVPEAFITAHDAVFVQAGLRMGETLLVNGATGGVGTAAIQLALAAGSRALANARSQSGLRRLAEMGAIPTGLDEARDVDVVLELVGIQHLEGSLRALRGQGRVMIVGTGAGAEGQVSLRALMGKRASITGTMLRARPLEQKAAAVQAFARQVVPLLERGAVRPLVDRVFAAEQAVEAFDHMNVPGKFGKVLLEF
jgi:NADPH:quinone reductase-like Zn-dependent oxidoreductase